MSDAAAVNFPGPLGSKRRRMRSGGGGGNNPVNNGAQNVSEEKMTQTSKCKGATTIPIFLKKTYKMVDTCDPYIASWTDDGEMFVVKDPGTFATQVIPQFFDHNKFSSFARQLNFYGFRKMQSKPIRNSDFDAGTAKHVTFYNENFKRGRCDLLKKIQRSTRGGGPASGTDQSIEIVTLKEQVAMLEKKVSEIAVQSEDRVRRLELDMLSRMEQMMLAVQQQQQTQLQLEKATSIGTMNGATIPNQASIGSQQVQINWDQASFQRAASMSSTISAVANAMVGGTALQFSHPNPGPTLPPHPKQKLMPLNGIMTGSMAAPPDRMNSLRGMSTLRGISTLSNLTRGASVETSASAELLRNSIEDKYFSMLMLDEQQQGENGTNILGMNPISKAPVTVSENSTLGAQNSMDDHEEHQDDTMSDVSNPDLS